MVKKRFIFFHGVLVFVQEHILLVPCCIALNFLWSCLV